MRVGANSSVKMISPSLTNTELAVNKGHAMIEVAEIHPQNDIRITDDGATTKLLKTGLYDFDSDRNHMRVFDGKAVVEDDGHRVTVKGGHQLNLASGSTFKTASLIRNRLKKEIYTVGAACVQPTSLKPMWTKPECTRPPWARGRGMGGELVLGSLV